MKCMRERERERERFRPHANKLIKLKGQKWDWRLDFGGLGQKGSREVEKKSKRECLKWTGLSHEYISSLDRSMRYWVLRFNGSSGIDN